MDNKGFTFVELMGVIVIIAIITTIAISSYNGIKKTTNLNICKQRVKQIEILAADYASDTNLQVDITNATVGNCVEQYNSCTTACGSTTSCSQTCSNLLTKDKLKKGSDYFVNKCTWTCEKTINACTSVCTQIEKACSKGSYAITTTVPISEIVNAGYIDDETLTNPITDSKFELEDIYISKSTNGLYEAYYEYECE